ncbi:hypothetical protein [Parasphingorhabdus sp.]|uniref:hypothetical protein n=1 Tax=Parasphingorhabdus sp. TaxID=2709688 RepID=UPI003A93B049
MGKIIGRYCKTVGMILRLLSAVAAMACICPAMAQEKDLYAVYSAAGLKQMQALNAQAWKRAQSYNSCQSRKTCSKETISSDFTKQGYKELNAIIFFCSKWLENSFKDTESDLQRWKSGPAEACNVDSHIFEYKSALPFGNHARREINNFDNLFNNDWKNVVIRHFQKSFSAVFLREQPSIDHARYPKAWQQFSLYTQSYLGWPYRGGNVPVPAIQARLDNLESGDDARTNASPVVAAQRAKQESGRNISGLEAFGKLVGIYGEKVKATGIIPDLSGKDDFLVPGKATFYGFIFGQTPADTGVPTYRDMIYHDKSQFTVAYPKGVAKSSVTTTRDGKVKLHCWEYFPKYRANPRRESCLYVAGGVIVGGLFPSNEFDAGLLRYIGKQGFRQIQSSGSKELGYPMLFNRYAMSDMTVHYKRYNVRYDRKANYYESDFCFFPTRLKASLGGKYTCTVIPRR